MSIWNKILLALLIGCFFLAAPASTTVIVVVITPAAMVIGADQKLFPDEERAVKIFLLKNHLVVGSLWGEKASHKNARTVLYDFQSWIKRIDEQTETEVSVAELASIIQNQAPSAFAFASEGLHDGTITKDMARESDINDVLAEYMVFGYEARVPTVYDIRLKIDWEVKALVPPVMERVHPVEGMRVNSRIIVNGIPKARRAILRTGIAGSQEHDELVSRVPVECQALTADEGFPTHLTPGQVSNLIRAMIAIGTEADPRHVGFPVTVITIPKGESGRVETFEKDVVHLSHLPQGAEGRHQFASR